MRDDERLVDLVDDDEPVDDEPVHDDERADRDGPVRRETQAGTPTVDDEPVLPRSTRDDTDAGWGERTTGNDDRLRAERPPHWGD